MLASAGRGSPSRLVTVCRALTGSGGDRVGLAACCGVGVPVAADLVHGVTVCRALTGSGSDRVSLAVCCGVGGRAAADLGHGVTVCRAWCVVLTWGISEACFAFGTAVLGGITWLPLSVWQFHNVSQHRGTVAGVI